MGRLALPHGHTVSVDAATHFVYLRSRTWAAPCVRIMDPSPRRDEVWLRWPVASARVASAPDRHSGGRGRAARSAQAVMARRRDPLDGVLTSQPGRKLSRSALCCSDPVEGAPASEATEVRVLFDGDTSTLAFAATTAIRRPSSDPARTRRRSRGRRPRHHRARSLLDHRNGFFFRVTWRERDARSPTTRKS